MIALTEIWGDWLVIGLLVGGAIVHVYERVRSRMVIEALAAENRRLQATITCLVTSDPIDPRIADELFGVVRAGRDAYEQFVLGRVWPDLIDWQADPRLDPATDWTPDR